MTDIKALLDSCPLMEGFKADELVGLTPGVFPHGVVKTRADILGNVKAVKRYSLKKRCVRGDPWAEAVTAWAMAQGLAVTGGKMTAPANDGTAVYEVTVEI